MNNLNKIEIEILKYYAKYINQEIDIDEFIKKLNYLTELYQKLKRDKTEKKTR